MHRPVRIRCPRLRQEALDLFDDTRVLGGDVLLFIHSLPDIIEFQRLSVGESHALPLVVAERLPEVWPVDLPVQIFVLLLGLAEQFRQERDAVDVVGNARPGNLSESRHQIPECTNVVAHPAGLNLAGPAGQSRHADAAIVEVTLVAAQRSVGVEELVFVAALFVRAVV